MQGLKYVYRALNLFENNEVSYELIENLENNTTHHKLWLMKLEFFLLNKKYVNNNIFMILLLFLIYNNKYHL